MLGDMLVYFNELDESETTKTKVFVLFINDMRDFSAELDNGFQIL